MTFFVKTNSIARVDLIVKGEGQDLNLSVRVYQVSQTVISFVTHMDNLTVQISTAHKNLPALIITIAVMHSATTSVKHNLPVMISIARLWQSLGQVFIARMALVALTSNVTRATSTADPMVT